MRPAIIHDGLFEVYEDGRIFRHNGKALIEAAQCRTSRDGKYLTVTAMVGGFQKHFYVHRLVAEAFLPNPDNLPQVNHKDGNGHNNHVSNLEWCTGSQNIRHAYDVLGFNPHVNAKPCLRCGTATHFKSQICSVCDRVLRVDARKIDYIAKIRDDLTSIDTNLLTDTQLKYFACRVLGLTYKEIGDLFGVTAQCVELSIKNANKKISEATA